MVYCSKCGTQNPDDARVCVRCGAPLYSVGQQYPGSEREHYRHVEGECFALPTVGIIAALAVGVIIILVGLVFFLQTSWFTVNFWPVAFWPVTWPVFWPITFWPIFWSIIIAIFGILLLIGVAYGRQRYIETHYY